MPALSKSGQGLRAAGSVEVAVQFADRMPPLPPNQKREEEAQKILAALREGSLSLDLAFDRLFRSHYAAVRWLFRQWLTSPEDREELTQETFLRIYLSIEAFRGDCSFSTYLFKLAKNVFLGHRRSKLAEKRSGIEVSLTGSPETGEEPSTEPLPPVPPEQEDAVLRTEQEKKLLEVVGQMPDQRRKCLILKYYQDRSVQEIAALLHLAEGTVKAHLHQGREQLRTLLGADALTERT